MSKALFAYLSAATALMPACSTMSQGEYTAGWNEGGKTEVIKLSNGFSLRYLRAGRGPPARSSSYSSHATGLFPENWFPY